MFLNINNLFSFTYDMIMSVLNQYFMPAVVSFIHLLIKGCQKQVEFELKDSFQRCFSKNN